MVLMQVYTQVKNSPCWTLQMYAFYCEEIILPLKIKISDTQARDAGGEVRGGSLEEVTPKSSGT